MAAETDVVLLSRTFKPPAIEISVELSNRNNPILKVATYEARDIILKDFLMNHVRMITVKKFTTK